MNFGSDEKPTVNDKFYKMMTFTDAIDEKEPIVAFPSPTFDTIHTNPSTNYFENIINSTRSLNEIPKHAFSLNAVNTIDNYEDFITYNRIETKENLFGECNPYIDFPKEESQIPEYKYEKSIINKPVQLEDSEYEYFESLSADENIYDIKEIIDKNGDNVVTIPLQAPKKEEPKENQMIVYKKPSLSDILFKEINLEQNIDIRGAFKRFLAIKI